MSKACENVVCDDGCCTCKLRAELATEREAHGCAIRLNNSLGAELEKEREARRMAEAERDRLSRSCKIADTEVDTIRELWRLERDRTDALVAALPKCDGCEPSRTATKSFGRGRIRCCDECGAESPLVGPEVPDYPRAEPLRAIQRARAEERDRRTRCKSRSA